MADVMDALRVMAEARGAAKPQGNMPLMNKLLLGTIKTFGRTYDLGAMALYKAGTASYGKDLDKLPDDPEKREDRPLAPPRRRQENGEADIQQPRKTRKKST